MRKGKDFVRLQVLFEDNHLLAVVKPALLPTMGVAAGEPSLLDEAKKYIKRKYNKPGNVYLGIVSRLDAPVTGVLLIARTSKAAKRLNEQFRARDVDKTYWAVVEGRLRPESGVCIDWLRKDERHRRVHVASASQKDASEARLSYRTLDAKMQQSLLEVKLETGRKHQIRVQLAHCGHPIIGDRKYGSRRPFEPGIALHARSIGFMHPVGGEPMELVAPAPKSWRTLSVLLPGALG